MSDIAPPVRKVRRNKLKNLLVTEGTICPRGMNQGAAAVLFKMDTTSDGEAAGKNAPQGTTEKAMKNCPMCGYDLSGAAPDAMGQKSYLKELAMKHGLFPMDEKAKMEKELAALPENVRKELEENRTKLAKQEKDIAAMQDIHLTNRIEKELDGMGAAVPGVDRAAAVELLKKADKGEAVDPVKLRAIIKASIEMADSAKLFGINGAHVSEEDAPAGSAKAIVDKEVAALIKDNPKLSPFQARDQVYKANPSLLRKEMQEEADERESNARNAHNRI